MLSALQLCLQALGDPYEIPSKRVFKAHQAEKAALLQASGFHDRPAFRVSLKKSLRECVYCPLCAPAHTSVYVCQCRLVVSFLAIFTIQNTAIYACVTCYCCSGTPYLSEIDADAPKETLKAALSSASLLRYLDTQHRSDCFTYWFPYVSYLLLCNCARVFICLYLFLAPAS
jgi:hypothetical protein